jgi:hypothetical protein
MVAKMLILVPLLLAAACSGRGPAINEQAPSESVRQDGTAGERAAGAAATGARLARLPESRLGDAAAAVGTLRAEGACIYLEAAGSTRYLIASTIPGARWDAAQEALVVPSGGAEAGAATYRSGERVTLGGSEARAATLSGQWVETPAATCDIRRIWITNSIMSAGSD